ncbi:MAG: radical SAM protein [archaeon]
MRIALITPVQTFNRAVEIIPYPSLGLLYLAAYLEKKGHKVRIIDLPFLMIKNKENMTFSRVREILKEYNPDVIGITTRCLDYPFDILLARNIKRFIKKPIIFGGVQATHTAYDTIKEFKWVDFVVKGEGEVTFIELLTAIKEGRPFNEVRGIVYREGNRVIETKDRPFIEDIDCLPLPAYHLIPKVKKYGLDAIPLITTRGCPFNCAFCSVSTMWKRTLRCRGVRSIMQEIKRERKRQGLNHVSIKDDTFTVDNRRLKILCREFKKEGVTWTCFSRVDTIDEDMLELMKDSGCNGIFYGVESASVRILKKIRKGDKRFLENARKNIKKCHELGLEQIVSFIIGFPSETEKEIAKTVDMAEKMKKRGCSTQVHFLSPLSGSDIYKSNKNNLIFVGHSSDVSSVRGLSKKYVDLIKKYPHIFPQFYIIKNSALAKWI